MKETLHDSSGSNALTSEAAPKHELAVAPLEPRAFFKLWGSAGAQHTTARLVSLKSFAFLFAILISLQTGCGKHSDKAASPQLHLPTAIVRVQPVEAKKHLATEEVVGTVRAQLSASIEAKVSGRIAKMLVTQGQTVKAGESLAQLDAQEIQARLDQALAQSEQAERDLKRFTTLVAQNAVTRQEFEMAEARQRVSRAAVTEAQTLLGYASITAPFGGVITRKLADVGDLAVPGKALLEVEDPARLRLEADVPEALVGRVRIGATMSVRVPSLEREMTGTVSEIAPAADPGSRTILVKLDLPSAPDLRAGLFGRVAVPVADTSALRVPASALVVRGQLEMLFVVNEGKAQLRLVKTGKRIGSDIELLSGATAGERVVAEGAASLTDGQSVEVRQ